MKSNNTQYRTRQFLCCDFGYICMYTQRSNNILYNWMGCSSQTLTGKSRCRERAACMLISRHCGSTSDHRDTLRDSLKFVQEAARFVTSRFFGKKVTKGVWKGTKSSDKFAKLATLHTSLLLTSRSVWLQQHTHFQTYTHVQEYLDHSQSEVGSTLHYLGLV